MRYTFRALDKGQMMVRVCHYLLLILVLTCVSGASAAQNNSSLKIDNGLMKELTLTKSEKIALDKLKAALPKNVPMDYLKVDLFQMRWLRANKLNVDRTLQTIKEIIKYRENVRINDFLKQDWTVLFDQQPFNIDSVDRHGRPIAYVNIGEGWDIRRLILEGKRELTTQYIINAAFELLENRLWPTFQKQSNITQFVFLFNFDGFSTIQHFCPMCVPIYLELLQVYERLLPGFPHDLIFINAPSIFPTLLEVIRPVLTGYTMEVLKIFGPNRKQWKSFLDKNIDPAQLPWEFGGTKVVD